MHLCMMENLSCILRWYEKAVLVSSEVSANAILAKIFGPIKKSKNI